MSDSLAAASTLAQSPRARTIGLWVLASVVLPAAGWLTAKLDTQVQVTDLSGKVAALTGSVAALTSQQKDLVDSMSALFAPPDPIRQLPGGALFRLSSEQRYAQRGVVMATEIALGYETHRVQVQKKAWAQTVALAYDTQTLRDGKLPSDAAANVIAQIAPP